jgi:hypothetical protein
MTRFQGFIIVLFLKWVYFHRVDTGFSFVGKKETMIRNIAVICSFVERKDIFVFGEKSLQLWATTNPYRFFALSIRVPVRSYVS